MKIGLELSFAKGTLDGNYYIQLFEKYIKFNPYSFTKKYTTKAWDEKKHKKIIATTNSEDTIIVGSKTNDTFIAGETGSKSPHKSVRIIQDRELYFPSNSEIEVIINHQGFTAGYLYDEDYEVVQSTAYSNNYSHRNYPVHILNSVKETPYHINEFNEKQYDVKNNPGKMDLIGHCWLMAAYKMWFGKPFFEIVPKAKILNFTDAHEIKELEDGKVFVQLFEKIEESANDVNMEKQRKWRKWLEFEKLIETYK